jgi:hypothetical protein
LRLFKDFYSEFNLHFTSQKTLPVYFGLEMIVFLINILRQLQNVATGRFVGLIDFSFMHLGPSNGV